jgi:hypothetical protein
MDYLKIILRVAKRSRKFFHLMQSPHIFPLDSAVAPVSAPLEYLLYMLHVLIIPGHDIIVQVLAISATRSRFLQIQIAISLTFSLELLELRVEVELILQDSCEA